MPLYFAWIFCISGWIICIRRELWICFTNNGIIRNRTTTVRPTMDSAQPQPLSYGIPSHTKSWCQAVMTQASPHIRGFSRLTKKSYTVVLSGQWCACAACVAGRDGDLSGTWSTPPGFQGWQRSSRRTVSQVPLSGPNRSSAVIAYAEHEG